MHRTRRKCAVPSEDDRAALTGIIKYLKIPKKLSTF